MLGVLDVLLHRQSVVAEASTHALMDPGRMQRLAPFIPVSSHVNGTSIS